MTVRGGPNEWRVRAVLGGVLAIAVAVRVWGLAFGLPLVLARPDELFILGTVLRITGGSPNPGMFDYPSLYLYVLAGLFACYRAWTWVTGRATSHAEFLELFRTSWEPFFLIPRALSAVLGAATAGLCHAIAAPLFGVATAQLSALFLALAFLHVRDSHYATTDITAVFLVMCTMLAVVRVYQSRSARDAWLAGILGGLATGTKYNMAVVALPMAVIEVLYLWERRKEWRGQLRRTHLWKMAAGMIVAFAASTPFLFLDAATAMEQLRALQASTASGMTPPEMLGRGWTYHLPFSLRYGLGLPVLTASLAGLGWMSLRRPALALVLGAFPVAYYAAAGAGYNVFVRYMIPVVPFLCIFAAFFVVEAAAALSRVVRLPAGALAWLLGLCVIAPSAWSVVRFDALIARDDNRVVAAQWVHERVPAGSSIFSSGNLYGHPQLEPPDGKYRIYGYDRRALTFTHRQRIGGVARERSVPDLPEWIIAQRSPLPYSNMPDRIAALLAADYDLVHVIRAGNLSDPANRYDLQDGFYVPYAGFRGVTRPGPNFEIYRRRGLIAANR